MTASDLRDEAFDAARHDQAGRGGAGGSGGDSEFSAPPAAPIRNAMPLPPAFEVTCSADGMEARARALPEAARAREALQEALDEAGVSVDPDEAAVAALLAGRVDEVVVARGMSPIDGVDATVEVLCVDPATTLASDDPRAVLQHVVVGQVLARKMPAIHGAAGWRVTGELAPPRPALDTVKLTPGPGTKLDEWQIVSTLDGLPHVRGHGVSVTPVYAVKEVNAQTGDVHFAGTVTVEGDVRSGLTVHATGDVHVRGNVEGGKVLAGGRVLVRGGLRHATIEAYGDVAVRFIEPDSAVTCRGSLEVRDSALQSKLSARRIRVGRFLAGGTATAWERIEALTLGNAREAPVELVIEPCPVLTPLQVKLVQKQLVDVEREIGRLRAKIEAAGSDAKVVGPLSRKEVATELKRLSLVQKLAATEEAEGRARGGTIVAGRDIHRNVVVRIYEKVRAYRDRSPGVVLRLEEGEIKP